jgi:hypothetical protein
MTRTPRISRIKVLGKTADTAFFDEPAVLREEGDRLTAIFVSIIKQSKAAPQNS